MQPAQRCGVKEVTLTVDQGEEEDGYGPLLGMTEDNGVVWDAFYHQTTVEITEAGTTIPARYDHTRSSSTSVGFKPLPTPMYVNRPFLLAVVDMVSGAMVSLAKVDSPAFFPN
jgi:serine protease inhibitor